MKRATTAHRRASEPNSTHQAPESARGTYSQDNKPDLNNGCCAVCKAPLPAPSGPGRPWEYCSEPCCEVGAAVRQLRRALPMIERPGPVRSYLVAEALNRLPVDRDLLRDLARQQHRDSGGRFR